MHFAIPRLAQARRILRLQGGRLRSNEPTQIFVCAVFGAVIGALTTALHRLVDLAHHLVFNIAGSHTLSTGIGIDIQRLLIIPVLGGLALGIGVAVMRRVRPAEVVDPIEANALHGGRMSLRDSVYLALQNVISNGCGASVGLEAGYTQIASGLASRLGIAFEVRRSDLPKSWRLA